MSDGRMNYAPKEDRMMEDQGWKYIGTLKKKSHECLNHEN